MPSDIWASAEYRSSSGPRAQAVLDLLARAGHPEPRLVVDLGCGPGENTALIARRWPDALVIGVDSSPSMIEAAGKLEQPGHLEFRLGDLATWQPPEPADVILANASLQWLPDHVALLPRLAACLAHNGFLGFQMPGNLSGGRVSVLLGIGREVSLEPRWRDQLGSAFVGMERELLDVGGYISALAGAGLQAEAWETRYAYLQPGEGHLVKYAAGSYLRPALALLTPAEQGEFLAACQQRHNEVHPPLVIDGKRRELLVQERIFAVGRASAAL